MACTTTTPTKSAFSFIQIQYSMTYLPYILMDHKTTGMHFKLEDSAKYVSHPTLVFMNYITRFAAVFKA